MAADPAWDLTALLNAADPAAPAVERHLWFVRLLQWVRHKGPAAVPVAAEGATPAPVLRLRQLCQVLERHEAHRARVQALLAGLRRDLDTVSLFADFGFAPRASFGSELAQRLGARLLPATPETRSLAELFPLLFEPADLAWVQRLDAATLARLGALWPDDAPPAPGVSALSGWRERLLQAIVFLCSAVRAAGFAAPLRLRMDPAMLAHEPFAQLAAAADRLGAALRTGEAAAVQREAVYLRALLGACRRAADSVAAHLEQYGVSLQIVFETDQLKARTERIEQLLDCLLAPRPLHEAQHLLGALLRTQAQRRGLRALFAQHGTQLARQVAERNAETGEHYITRTGAEYRQMLRMAAGGGSIIALTTFGKFGVMALGLSAFWGGLWAGLNYALSFVVIMLLHWTVATKQPAMTAPAMAARLLELRASRDGGEAAVEGFVDELTHLIRSQVAGIVGNLALCFPLVLLVQGVAVWLGGAPLVGAREGEYVLHSLTLLGPSVLFAAFTGVLLFASSLIAGWVENGFVFHRLDSALAWNPRIVARLGPARAQRWARWWRAHVSGLAANVSLGLMLGLVPVLAGFFGLGLEVRHVTLSTGQLAAALGALGLPVLAEPAFWWCVAGIAVTGVLNVGVSFWLALRVALRARGVHGVDRRRITGALLRRLARSPGSFLWPPPAA